MWKVVADYEKYHRIVDEADNTLVAVIHPNYNEEIALEFGGSGDVGLDALEMIVEKHNQRIAELEVVKELLIKENNDVHDCLKEANKRIAELEEKLEETLVRLAKLKIRGVE